VALTILHADEQIVGIDKPSGRLVIPGRVTQEETVQEEAQRSFGRLWVVHRLDRGTSGVLVFARTAAAHRSLSIAFERHEVVKQYLALVRGVPSALVRIACPLAPARRGRMRPARPGDPGAKSAATRIRLVERHAARPPLPPQSLVEALPETGRTHQIRIHLAWSGTPLLIDPEYGESGPLADARGEILLARTPLHAARLELRHPSGGQLVRLEAAMPIDMANTLEAARGHR